MLVLDLSKQMTLQLPILTYKAYSDMGRPKCRPRRPKSFPYTSAKRSFVLTSAMEMSPQQMMADVSSYTFRELKADSVEKVHKWIDQIGEIV